MDENSNKKKIQSVIALIEVDSVEWVLGKGDQGPEWIRKKDIEIEINL